VRRRGIAYAFRLQATRFHPHARRPELPTSCGIQGSTEGVLGWDFVVERMRAGHNYWVVTCSREGRPHTTPVWGLWMEQAFYFSTDARSRKARNIEVNRSVIVHLESGNEVVILEGEARAVGDGPLIQTLSTEYFAKYAVRREGGPVFEVKLAKALAWRERDFPSSATRFRLAP
jgi:hypothetical protein